MGFMLSGTAFASWVVRIPDVQSRLNLSEGELGLALLAVAAGGLGSMALSGALISRFGSRTVARAAGLTLALALALPARLPTAPLVALALLVLGGATSVLSVALNTQAASLERRMRRPIMAGLHALYSLGGLVGAGIGGLVAGAGAGATAHLDGAALLIGGATLVSARALLHRGLDGAIGAPAFARPTRPLALMGLVAFCVLFGEGAVADWSAVYLRDAVGAGPALAAAGYAAFSLMMAIGRFAGDALTVRLGPSGIVRLGAGLATAGMILAVGQGQPSISVVGFGAVGAGLSTIFPTVLATAGRATGAAPASAIAAVSSLGYVGLLAGPPLIGFAAEATSLPVALGLVGVTSALILLLAKVVPTSLPFSARGGRSRRPPLAAAQGTVL